MAVIGFTMNVELIAAIFFFLCLSVSQMIMAKITFQVNHSGIFPDVRSDCNH